MSSSFSERSCLRRTENNRGRHLVPTSELHVSIYASSHTHIPPSTHRETKKETERIRKKKLCAYGGGGAVKVCSNPGLYPALCPFRFPLPSFPQALVGPWLLNEAQPTLSLHRGRLRLEHQPAPSFPCQVVHHCQPLSSQDALTFGLYTGDLH